jgi:hypothetical protein
MLEFNLDEKHTMAINHHLVTGLVIGILLLSEQTGFNIARPSVSRGVLILSTCWGFAAIESDIGLL